ncbi:MAG: hypothetical protein M0017_03130 [Desulfobacteraceae bacterium]|nr:hypothetical protein [Desulfobacteraceae bacterium]
MERRGSAYRPGVMAGRPWWALLLLLLAGGCSLPHGRRPEQEPVVKREIYRQVAASIAASRQRGETLLARGDLHGALDSYREAAYYDQSPELHRQISELETKIAKESKRLVAEGQALAGKDEEAALKAFNRALRLDPGNREARQARDRLLAKPKLQAELAARQETLRRTWDHFSGKPGEIAALTAQAAAVLDYQADNELALKVQGQIGQQQQDDIRLHLDKGLEAYQAGRFEQAKLEAQKARAIDPQDPEVLSFLQKIQKEQDIAYFVNLARHRLEEGDLDKAKELARKALALDPDRQAANAIVQKVQVAELRNSLERAKACFARQQYDEAMVNLQRVQENGPRMAEWPGLQASIQEILRREVPAMIDQAQKLFVKNHLQQSSQILARVLSLDPNNSVAATYLKKIQSRLETLQSLQ